MQLSERHLISVLEGAGVIAFVTVAIPTSADPDLWGHLRFGLDTLHLHRLPPFDPYSFTSDRAWINHEWLSETIMAAIYGAGGVPALVTFKIVLVALLAAIMWTVLRRSGVSSLGRVAGTAFAVTASLAVLHSIRPHLWSVFLTVVLLNVLTRAREKPRMLLFLPLIFVAWANLHGGWMIGLLITGSWLAGGWLQGVLSLRRVVLVGSATVAATLVNPYGYGLWLFLAETVRTSREDITEWLPITNSPPYLFIWSMTTVLTALAVVRGNRAPTLLAAAALAYASWRVQRVVPFFVLVAIWIALPTLSPLSPAPHRVYKDRDRWLAGLLGVAALFGAMVAFAAQTRAALPCITIQEATSPDQSAAAGIRGMRLRGRMITSFDWGEYAIWHFGPDLQVSMDGRRETVYTDGTLRAHRAFLQRGFAAWPALEAKNPDYVWVPRAFPVTKLLPDGGWQPLITTPDSIVWSRTRVAADADARATRGELSGCFPGLT